MRASLRLRVVAAAVATVAVVSIAAGALLVALVRHDLRATLDDRLAGQARTVASIARSREATQLALALNRPENRGLRFDEGITRVLSGDTVILEFGHVPHPFPKPRANGYATVEAGHASWRTLTRRLTADPALDVPANLRMQVARPRGPTEATVDAVRRRVVLLAGLGLGLTAALGWALTGLALRPLGRLRIAAWNVASTQDLAMRVPAGTGPVEVDALAESLNAMLARLQTSVAATEAALDASRGFAANAAHELRTPLTSIQANLDALHRNPAMPEQERQETLGDINAELARLVALLEALRTLARGEASEGLSTEQVDFADLVDAAVEGTRRRHPDVELTFDDPGGEAAVEGWAEGLRKSFGGCPRCWRVRSRVERRRRWGGARFARQSNMAAVSSAQPARASAPAASRTRDPGTGSRRKPGSAHTAPRHGAAPRGRRRWRAPPRDCASPW